MHVGVYDFGFDLFTSNTPWFFGEFIYLPVSMNKRNGYVIPILLYDADLVFSLDNLY